MRGSRGGVTIRSVSVLLPTMVCAFVACGPRSAGAQAPADPCAQITATQVSAALGETVAAGQKAGTKTCSWTAEKPTHQVVSLMYSPPGDWNTRKTRPPIAQAVAAKV